MPGGETWPNVGTTRVFLEAEGTGRLELAGLAPEHAQTFHWEPDGDVLSLDLLLDGRVTARVRVGRRPPVFVWDIVGGETAIPLRRLL